MTITMAIKKKKVQTPACLSVKVEISVVWESVGVGSRAGDDKSRARCSLSPSGLIHTSLGQVWEADTGSCSESLSI